MTTLENDIKELIKDSKNELSLFDKKISSLVQKIRNSKTAQKYKSESDLVSEYVNYYPIFDHLIARDLKSPKENINLLFPIGLDESFQKSFIEELLSATDPNYPGLDGITYHNFTDDEINYADEFKKWKELAIDVSGQSSFLNQKSNFFKTAVTLFITQNGKLKRNDEKSAEFIQKKALEYLIDLDGSNVPILKKLVSTTTTIGNDLPYKAKALKIYMLYMFFIRTSIEIHAFKINNIIDSTPTIGPTLSEADMKLEIQKIEGLFDQNSEEFKNISKWNQVPTYVEKVLKEKFKRSTTPPNFFDSLNSKDEILKLIEKDEYDLFLKDKDPALISPSEIFNVAPLEALTWYVFYKGSEYIQKFKSDLLSGDDNINTFDISDYRDIDQLKDKYNEFESLITTINAQLTSGLYSEGPGTFGLTEKMKKDLPNQRKEIEKHMKLIEEKRSTLENQSVIGVISLFKFDDIFKIELDKIESIDEIKNIIMKFATMKFELDQYLSKIPTLNKLNEFVELVTSIIGSLETLSKRLNELEGTREEPIVINAYTSLSTTDMGSSRYNPIIISDEKKVELQVKNFKTILETQEVIDIDEIGGERVQSQILETIYTSGSLMPYEKEILREAYGYYSSDKTSYEDFKTNGEGDFHTLNGFLQALDEKETNIQLYRLNFVDVNEVVFVRSNLGEYVFVNGIAKISNKFDFHSISFNGSTITDESGQTMLKPLLYYEIEYDVDFEKAVIPKKPTPSISSFRGTRGSGSRGRGGRGGFSSGPPRDDSSDTSDNDSENDEMDSYYYLYVPFVENPELIEKILNSTDSFDKIPALHKYNLPTGDDSMVVDGNSIGIAPSGTIVKWFFVKDSGSHKKGQSYPTLSLGEIKLGNVILIAIEIEYIYIMFNEDISDDFKKLIGTLKQKSESDEIDSENGLQFKKYFFRIPVIEKDLIANVDGTINYDKIKQYCITNGGPEIKVESVVPTNATTNDFTLARKLTSFIGYNPECYIHAKLVAGVDMKDLASLEGSKILLQITNKVN